MYEVWCAYLLMVLVLSFPFRFLKLASFRNFYSSDLLFFIKGSKSSSMYPENNIPRTCRCSEIPKQFLQDNYFLNPYFITTMKRIILFTLLIVSLSGFFRVGFGQTDVPAGEASGTWYFSEAPYRIQGDILIPPDSTLLIEPGVKVEFMGYFRINVEGTLLAEGTPTDSIIFTVKDTTGFSNPLSTTGGWNGIRFFNTSFENDSSRIRYCLIEYGKAIASNWPDNSGGAVCIVNFDKVEISHCWVRNNMAAGSEAPSGGAIHLTESNIRLAYNRIEHNHAELGGAIQLYNANPTFYHNQIANNSAKQGGGILIFNDSNPTFEGDSIMNNQAMENGGGLMSWSGGVIHFESVVVTGNQASWGSGLGFSGDEVKINRSDIHHNQSGGLGGGIGADFCTLTIDQSTVNDNTASMSGGIHAYYSDVEVRQSVVSRNISDFGGGIHADFSRLFLKNCDFLENQANNGGGLHIWNSDLIIDSCEFKLNQVSSEGGAIEYNLADTMFFGVPYQLRITGTDFRQNIAGFRSAGMRIEQYNQDTSLASIFIDQCHFFQNHAERISSLRIAGNLKDFQLSNTIFNGNSSDLWVGGASFSGSSSGQVINCEFSDNSAAQGNPCGVGVSNGSWVHFFNCTFAKNVSMATGGLSVHRNGKASVTNCIFWGNTANQISVRGINEGSYSELYINYSNVQYGKDSVEVDSLAALYWGEGNIDGDPLFMDPDNGDYHLLKDSPCIDAGTDQIEILGTIYTCPLADLEGNSRSFSGQEGPDMGAFENQTVIGIPVETSTDDLLIKLYPNPFREFLVVEFEVRQVEEMSITIYNAKGKEVACLVNNELFKKGIYKVIWNARGMENGLYFCQLISRNRVSNKKLVVDR